MIILPFKPAQNFGVSLIPLSGHPCPVCHYVYWCFAFLIAPGEVNRKITGSRVQWATLALKFMSWLGEDNSSAFDLEPPLKCRTYFNAYFMFQLYHIPKYTWKIFLEHVCHAHIGSCSLHPSGSLDSGLKTSRIAEHFLSSLQNPRVSVFGMTLEITTIYLSSVFSLRSPANRCVQSVTRNSSYFSTVSVKSLFPTLHNISELIHASSDVFW